uniref:SGNH hydrolase-type esterase domain-containing protein n=1 Tax=viral metagenome TaxID=1070528 RepID=A0A6C0AN93_9ZZZZ
MIVFIGDSIFQWWDPEHFKIFSKYETINFGVAGYTTKNVLDFLVATNLHGLKPEVIVILIGTNNSDRNYTTAGTLAEIKDIIDVTLELSPKSKILLMGILPRGDSNADRKRVFNSAINKLLKAEKFQKEVYYIDIGYMFLKGDENETISKEIMYDGLHLTTKGYGLLSDAISSFIMILIDS